MAREYFCAYHSYLKSTELLTDAECGRLFRACLEYSMTGISPELRGSERYVFPTIQQQIDRDREKYNSFCESQREKIKKRWDTTVYNGKFGIPDDTKNTKEKTKTKTKENEKESKKKKSFSPPSFEEVESYCKERNSSVDPRRFFDYYEAGGWKDNKGNSVKNWKQKLIAWESRDERGENHAGKPAQESPSGSTAEASKQKYGNYI